MLPTLSTPFSLRSYYRFQWRTVAVLATLCCVFVASIAVTPVMINKLLEYFLAEELDLEPTPRLTGFGYAVALFCCLMFTVISSNLCDCCEYFLGQEFKSLFYQLLYRKSLVVDPSHAPSSGDVMTFFSVDVEKLWDYFVMSHTLFTAPICIIACAVVLYTYIGWAAVAMVVGYAAFSAGAFGLSRLVARVRENMLLATTDRAGLETELLQSVRTLKLYGWTTGLVKTRVAWLRAKEVTYQSTLLLLMGIANALPYVAQAGNVGLVMGCLVLIPAENGPRLTVAVSYTVLAFVGALKEMSENITYSLNCTSEARVSYKRLMGFLNLPENQDPPTVLDAGADDPQTVAIFDDADLYWRRDIDAIVRGVRLSIKKGELVFIVGETGAGKSCLLQSLIGKVHVERTMSVTRRTTLNSVVAGAPNDSPLDQKPVYALPFGVTNKVSFTSQEPWLRNATVRQNVLFGQPMNEPLYRRCLKAAQMERDLQAFALGDMTPIGEKGRTLSGGQQARVALARALYRSVTQGSELVVLDDPLAAVDTRVAGGIVREALKGLLLEPAGVTLNPLAEDENDLQFHTERAVIVAINSHYHLLKEADKVIVLSGGKVSAVGTFEEVQYNSDLIRLLTGGSEDQDDQPRVQRQLSNISAPRSEGARPRRESEAANSDSGSDDEYQPPPQTIGHHLERLRSSHKIGKSPEIRPTAAPPALPSANWHARVSLDAGRLSRQMSSHNFSAPVGNPSTVSLHPAGHIQPVTHSAEEDDTHWGIGAGMAEEDVVDGAVKFETHKCYFKTALTPINDNNLFSEASAEDEAAAAAAKPWTVSRFIGKIVIGFLSICTIAITFLAVPAGKWSIDFVLGLWTEGETNPEWSNEKWLIIYFSMVIGLTLIMFIKEFIVMWVAVSASKKLHDKAFLRVMHASVPNFFDVTPIGRVLNRFTRDIDSIDIRLPVAYAWSMSMAGTVCVLLVTCVIATPWFLLFLPFVGLIFIHIQKLFRRVSVSLKRLAVSCHSPLVSVVEETLQPAGLAVVRAFRAEDMLIKQVKPLINSSAKAHMAFWLTARFFAIRLDILACLVTLCASTLLVFLKADKAGGSGVDPKLAGLAVTYVMSLANTLQWMTRQFIEAENNLTAVERLNEYARLPLEAPLATPVAPLPVGPPTDATPEDIAKALKDGELTGHEIVDVPVHHGHGSMHNDTLSMYTSMTKRSRREFALEFRHFWLRYRANLPYVLKDVSFTVRPGERLAVVGRSGAGKSTLSQAMFRMVEGAAGQVLVEGIDNRKMGVAQLRGDNFALQALRASHDIPEDEEDKPAYMTSSVVSSRRASTHTPAHARVTLVPQEPVLLAGSLRDNLDPLHSEGPSILPFRQGLRGCVIEILSRRMINDSYEHWQAQDLKNDSVAELVSVLERVGIWQNQKDAAQEVLQKFLLKSARKRRPSGGVLSVKSGMSGGASNAGADSTVDPQQQIKKQRKAAKAKNLILPARVRGIHDRLVSRMYEGEMIAEVIELTDGEILDMQGVIAAGGANLSMGERQLICVARALLRRASVILLDEATANVDSYTSQLVQDAVRKALNTADTASVLSSSIIPAPAPAVLTIAHRLDTAVESDRVMVMGDGRVLEIGSPLDLIDGREGIGELRKLVDDAGEEEMTRVKAILAAKLR